MYLQRLTRLGIVAVAAQVCPRMPFNAPMLSMFALPRRFGKLACQQALLQPARDVSGGHAGNIWHEGTEELVGVDSPHSLSALRQDTRALQ